MAPKKRKAAERKETIRLRQKGTSTSGTPELAELAISYDPQPVYSAGVPGKGRTPPYIPDLQDLIEGARQVAQATLKQNEVRATVAEERIRSIHEPKQEA